MTVYLTYRPPCKSFFGIAVSFAAGCKLLRSIRVETFHNSLTVIRPGWVFGVGYVAPRVRPSVGGDHSVVQFEGLFRFNFLYEFR